MQNSSLLNIEHLAKKYDETNIPLYLSYPVESQWNSEVNTQILVEKMKGVENPFVYLHFPYCKTSCYYCCAYRCVTSDDEVKDVYIDNISRELELKSQLLGLTSSLRTSQMHWGGGTPTYMTLKQLEKLFNTISKRVNILSDSDSSISIEAYPDESIVTPEKLNFIKDLGFNTISFGVQDFDTRVQQAVNRDCKVDIVRKLIEYSRQIGLEVHIDLCYGLPFQGLNEFEKTVNLIADMQPHRIVHYPYAHFPFAYPMQKMIPSSSLPNSFIKVLLAQTAEEILVSKGYTRVGHDSFARNDTRFCKDMKEGKINRDFMGSSTESRKDLLGIGSSAISFLGDLYCQNHVSIDSYKEAIDNNLIPLNQSHSHILNIDDKIRKKVILNNILCYFKISKKAINEEFSIDFDQYFEYEKKALEQLEKDGFIVNTDEDTIELTKTGIYFARHVAHIFDAYYNKKGKTR